MGAQIGVEYALGGHDVILHARDASRVAERVDAAQSLLRDAWVADARRGRSGGIADLRGGDGGGGRARC